MLKMTRLGLLFLSLLFSAQTWAEAGPCTLQPESIGNYFSSEILSDGDFRKAVACAVNRAGHDVIGESSFRDTYDVRIDEADIDLIKAVRNSELEPSFNQKNIFAVRFRAVYQNRLLTAVRCRAAVDFQKIPKEYVVVTLSECSANVFGTDPGHPLQAMAAFTPLKKK